MKRFLILSALVSTVFSSFAQAGKVPKKNFGFRIGGNYSLMNFNKGVPQLATMAPNSWKPGVDLRLLLNVKLTESINIQPEYALSLWNGEDKRIKTTYQLIYLSLPLLLRVAVSENIAILAGPQFDLLIHASRKVNGARNDITTTPKKEISRDWPAWKLRCLQDFILTPGICTDLITWGSAKDL